MPKTISLPGWLLPLMVMGIALLAISLWAFNGTAQAQPDADNEGMIAEEFLFIPNPVSGDTDSGWNEIPGLSGTLHKAAWKDLVVDVSLECGLYTNTEVKSKGNTKQTAQDTSIAAAGIQVRVLINGDEAKPMAPGKVTFCRRSQTLSAVFQGLLTNEDGTVCIKIDPVTGLHIIDESCLEYEELQLILDTTNANAFNFVVRDLPQGDYEIEVQARLTTSTSSENGSATAEAIIGKGSAIATEVRFAKTTAPD